MNGDLSNRCGLAGGALLLIALAGCARELLPADMELSAAEQRDAGAGGASGGGNSGDSTGESGGGQPGTGDAVPPSDGEPADAGFTSGQSGGSSGGGTSGTGFMIPDFGLGDEDAAVPELTDAAPKASGDLVISELLPYPEGSTPHEWIELYNPTAATFNLVGCTLLSGTGQHVIRSTVLVGPSSYVVLGQDEASSDGVPVFYTYDDASFSNSSDTVTFACGELTIDSLGYESELTERGKSIQLSATMLSANANDSASALCFGTSTIGISQNFGTPGTINTICP